MDEQNESRRWYWIYRPDLGRYVQMWHSFWRSLELVRREAEEAHGEQASAGSGGHDIQGQCEEEEKSRRGHEHGCRRLR